MDKWRVWPEAVRKSLIVISYRLVLLYPVPILTDYVNQEEDGWESDYEHFALFQTEHSLGDVWWQSFPTKGIEGDLF